MPGASPPRLARLRWILRDPTASPIAANAARPHRAPFGSPATLHPHDDFFVSTGAGAADPLGAESRPIFSASAFDTHLVMSLHVVVAGHVLSGAQRCVATSFCAASVDAARSSSLPICTQRGTGRHTSDGEQLPSFWQTDGSHHEKPASVLRREPAGQSSADATEGNARIARATASGAGRGMVFRMLTFTP